MKNRYYYTKEICERIATIGEERAALGRIYGDFATLNITRHAERVAIRVLIDDLDLEAKELMAAIKEGRIIDMKKVEA